MKTKHRKSEHYDRGESDPVAWNKFCTGQSLFGAKNELGFVQARANATDALLKLKPKEKKILADAEALVSKLIERWSRLR